MKTSNLRIHYLYELFDVRNINHNNKINKSNHPPLFKRQTKKGREYANKRSDNKLVCHECDKVLSSISCLKKHMMIHAIEPQFPCDVCKKLFVQKVSLDRHAIIHTGTKQFSCDKCGKEFYRMDNSKRHMMKCSKFLKTYNNNQTYPKYQHLFYVILI